MRTQLEQPGKPQAQAWRLERQPVWSRLAWQLQAFSPLVLQLAWRPVLQQRAQAWQQRVSQQAWRPVSPRFLPQVLLSMLRLVWQQVLPPLSP